MLTGGPENQRSVAAQKTTEPREPVGAVPVVKDPGTLGAEVEAEGEFEGNLGYIKQL